MKVVVETEWIKDLQDNFKLVISNTSVYLAYIISYNYKGDFQYDVYLGDGHNNSEFLGKECSLDQAIELVMGKLESRTSIDC